MTMRRTSEDSAQLHRRATLNEAGLSLVHGASEPSPPDRFDDPAETTIYGELVRVAVEATGAHCVLDVGCGSARPTLEAAWAGAREVVGIDIQERSLAEARANIRRAALEGRVSAQHASWDDVHRGRFPTAPDLVVANPPYVPKGRGISVDGGPYGTSLLNAIIDEAPPSAQGLALLFGSFSDPLNLMLRLAARGFEPIELLAYSVRFGRYTSRPSTLSHLLRLREVGRAFFCDTHASDGCAPHAYLTLGVVGRRRAHGTSSVAPTKLQRVLTELLLAYRARGPAALFAPGERTQLRIRA